MYRLLFLDLDGTLIHKDDTISPVNLQAVRAAEQHGCQIVICTGRNRYRAAGIARELGGHELGILLNCGIVYDWGADRILERTPIERWAAADAVTILTGHDISALCFAVTEDDRWVYTDEQLGPGCTFARRFPERMRYVPDLSKLPDSPVSIEAYAAPTVAEGILLLLRSHLAETLVAYTWDASYYGDLRGIHLHSARASKAIAAQHIADQVGISRDQVMAIGDEYNDLELLRWAGLGIAMGNGHEDCRAAANHVTACCWEDGVAQAIERFILSR